jgi:hypothetical protein
MPAEVIHLLRDDIGLCKRLLDTVRIELALEANVVAELRMDELPACERLFHIDHDRQLLPFGLDELHRVFGLRARFRDHRRARLALPAGALDGNRVLRRRLDALEVRKHRNPRRAVLRHRSPIKDSDDTRLLQCL